MTARLWTSEILNPLWNEHRTLVTPLPPAECADRLGARVAARRWPRTWFRPVHERPLEGWLDAGRFRVWRRVAYNTSHQTEARGRFIAAPEGTRVELRLSVSPVTLAVEALLVAWILAALGARAGVAPLAGPLEAMVEPFLIFMLFSLAFFHLVGRWIARDEDAFLVDLLRATLEARESPSTLRGPAPSHPA